MTDNFKLTINEAVFAKVQAQANAVGQSVLRDVNARMQGGDVAEIQAAIEAGMRAENVTPNAEAIAEYAQSIADGTLED
jgi:hypothetical protein